MPRPDAWRASRCGWGVALALVIGGWSASTRAGPPELLPPPPPAAEEGGGVRVRWQAPAGGCPTEAAIQSRVRALLGEAPLDLDATATVQQLAIAAREGSWRLGLQLRWAGGSDDRVLHARDCAALADATVVLVAVLAAPLATAPRFTPSGPLPSPVPTPTPVVPVEAPLIAPLPPRVAGEDVGPEPEVTAGPPEPVRPLPRRTRRTGAFARVAGVVGYGALPDRDVGVAIAAGGLLRRLRIEGTATFLPARTKLLADGTGGVVALAAGGVRVCPRLLGPTLELSLCGGVEVGASWSRSLGVTPPGRSAGPWLAFALGGALDWWFSPQVGLHVGLDGLAAPVTTRYLLGARELFGSAQVQVRAQVGLVFSLARQKAGEPEKRGR